MKSKIKITLTLCKEVEITHNDDEDPIDAYNDTDFSWDDEPDLKGSNDVLWKLDSLGWELEDNEAETI